jgi:hypothetical protein
VVEFCWWDRDGHHQSDLDRVHDVLREKNMSESLDQSVYMMTYSGRRFTMFDPQPEDILIEDIAHALSLLCRFTGHVQYFYSVAQHSVLVSQHVPAELAFEGLMHDAAEAYISDLSRPIKHSPRMQGYLKLEGIVERAIARKFGLPLQMSPGIKTVDNLLVCDEARNLYRKPPEWTTHHPSIGLDLTPWGPERAEGEFLRRFRAHGGDDGFFNFALTCVSCNWAKHSYTLSEFLSWLEWVKSDNSKVCLTIQKLVDAEPRIISAGSFAGSKKGRG